MDEQSAAHSFLKEVNDVLRQHCADQVQRFAIRTKLVDRAFVAKTRSREWLGLKDGRQGAGGLEHGTAHVTPWHRRRPGDAFTWTEALQCASRYSRSAVRCMTCQYARLLSRSRRARFSVTRYGIRRQAAAAVRTKRVPDRVRSRAPADVAVAEDDLGVTRQGARGLHAAHHGRFDGAAIEPGTQPVVGLEQIGRPLASLARPRALLLVTDST